MKNTLFNLVEKIGKESEENAEHIRVLNEEMGGIQVELGKVKEHIAGMKTDISWIKKLLWFVITTSITTLLAVLIQLLRFKM